MKACTLFSSDNEVAEDWLVKFNSREPLDICGQKYLIDEISTDYEHGFAGVTIKMYPVLQIKIADWPKKEYKMNIDWSKAPEGATHAGTTAGLQIPVFYKDIREDKYSYWYDDGDGWREEATGNPSCTPLIERPKKQEAWDGVGLPPVNCFCETLDEDADCWVKVEIYAHTEFMGETHACAKNGTDMFYGLANEFRPIKTAEQLAKDELEDAANKMFQRLGGVGGLTKKQCIWVVSEGYRKQ